MSDVLHTPEHVQEMLRLVGRTTDYTDRHSVEEMREFMAHRLDDFSRRQLWAVLRSLGLTAPAWSARRDLIAVLVYGWVRQQQGNLPRQ